MGSPLTVYPSGILTVGHLRSKEHTILNCVFVLASQKVLTIYLCTVFLPCKVWLILMTLFTVKLVMLRLVNYLLQAWNFGFRSQCGGIFGHVFCIYLVLSLE